MVDKKKDEELTDDELAKATGGTDDRRPVLKHGHIAQPGHIDPPILTPRIKKAQRASGEQVLPD